MAGKRSQGAVSFAPVGNTLENGFELGGSRIYPFSTGMAITPPAYYSDYIGPATGLPVSVPAGGLPDTVGVSHDASTHAARVEAAEHPFGRTSPLPWVVVGLIGGVGALYATHYRERKRGD